MRKIISLIVIGFLVLMDLNLVRGSLSSSNKLGEVSVEDKKIQNLQKENQDLKKKLAETDSNFFIEKQARDKLGFGKSGETKIIVKNEDLSLSRDEKTTKEKTNPEKWLDLITN